MIKDLPQVEHAQYVSLPEDLLDQITEVIVHHNYDPSDYVADLVDIAKNIEDQPSMTISTDHEEVDEVFTVLEKLLPTYIELLAASCASFGAETYSEGLTGIPMLTLSNGTKAFTLLHNAAIRLGLPASGKNQKRWYLSLAFFLQRQLSECQPPRH